MTGHTEKCFHHLGWVDPNDVEHEMIFGFLHGEPVAAIFVDDCEEVSAVITRDAMFEAVIHGWDQECVGECDHDDIPDWGQE